jgi:predicted GNAT family acetyltransferase
MASVMIGYSKRAGCTPAFAILAEGWNELVQSDLTPEGLAVSPVQEEDEVLYAISKEGDIVGALAFRQKNDVITTSLSYVEPSSRRKGVYTLMFNELLVRAMERAIVHLHSEVSVENKTMQAVLRHTGRAAVSLLFEMNLLARG